MFFFVIYNISNGPPHELARNLWNLSYFVTGTYPNMKSGCHHHQIGMDYLYDAILAASEVKLRFRLLLRI